MQTIRSSIDLDTTKVIEKNFTKTFLEDMLKNENRLPQGKRYSNDVKKCSTTLCYYSPKAYNFVRFVTNSNGYNKINDLELICVNNLNRSVLSLPDPCAIRNYMSNINAETRFLLNVLTEIGNFSDDERHCCLVLDSISIK